MAIKSPKQKGANGEREFAGLLYDHLGVKLKRNLDQTRSGGHDLMIEEGQLGGNAALLDRYAIEVKRAARARITDAVIDGWWDQAVEQAAKVGKVPVLAFKPDRQEWRVRIPLETVRYGETSILGYQVDLCVEGFCYVVRESL